MVSFPPFSSPLINEIYLAGPQLVFTFNNRFSSTGWAVPQPQSVRYIFFRLQPSYFSATSHTGRKACRVKSLYMKRFWEELTHLCWSLAWVFFISSSSTTTLCFCKRKTKWRHAGNSTTCTFLRVIMIDIEGHKVHTNI
jgi:hypothetical protein